jgi:TonB family protein
MSASRLSIRIVSLLPVAIVHIAALLALSQTFNTIKLLDSEAGVVRVSFLRPTRQSESADAAEAVLSQFAVTLDHSVDLSGVAQLPLDIVESRNGGTIISAPTLRGGMPVEMSSYVHQAGLLPGEGATVILRIEVLASGEPGRVAVDVSSGSRQVDQAAAGYARQLRWFAGRTNETPEVMWIRWSIRLQA